MLAFYLAAWLRLWNRGTRSRLDGNQFWEGVVYGSGEHSVCGGGDGEVEQCLMRTPSMV